MKNYNKTILASLIGSLIAGVSFSVYANAVDVKVDPIKRKYIGGVSDLSRDKFFNLHGSPTAAEFSAIDVLYIKNELNAGFGRSFWGPLSAAGSANYPTTEQAVEQGLTSVANAKSNPLYTYSDRRTVATEHPYNVIVDGNDPVEGARWAADYFENYYDDNNRPLFYEPMNEPFVHTVDFVGNWEETENHAMREHMATWFAEIGRAFDERGLDTKVIGYSSAWPSMELWDFEHWNTRQKMFMDLAGDHMDAFSFHLYDGINVTGQSNQRSGSNAEAIIDLIETYSFIKWGEVKPHAVTEYGGIIEGYGAEYSDEKSAQELRSYNQILFSLLEREDRILTSVPFITGISKWYYENNDLNPYSATVVRPDPENIVNGKVLNYLPTEKAKFFELWKDVKGHRVEVNETDADLAVQAFNYGDKLYIALNNFDSDIKPVDLSFVETQQTPTSVRIKRLDVPFGGAANYSDEVSNELVTSLDLAANETVVLEYQYAEPIFQETVVNAASYYSSTYLQPILAKQPLTFKFNDVNVQQDDLSFADVYAEYFAFDETKYQSLLADVQQKKDASQSRFGRFFSRLKAFFASSDDTPVANKLFDRIDSQNAAEKLAVRFSELSKHQHILKSFEHKFNRLLKKHPNDWQHTKRFAKLLEKAQRSAKLSEALHFYYMEHGYNDATSDATIRVSLGRKHDKSKQPKLLVNGHSVEVPDNWRGYDQLTRDDFFGTIEVPVASKYLKKSNNVSLTFPDSDGHVSSVIIQNSTQSPIELVLAEQITIDAPADAAINKDKPYRLTASVYPANTTYKHVDWSSNDPNVATIDQHGVVTPVSSGFVNFTATTSDGLLVDSVELEILDKESIRNTVVIADELQQLDALDNYTFNIQYSTDTERDVVIDIFNDQGAWFDTVRTTVQAGSGSTSVTLYLDAPLIAGATYQVAASLRDVNGDWRTIEDSHKLTDMTILEPEIVDTNNLLAINNGDFESGGMSPWKTNAWDTLGEAYVSAEAAKDGEYGLVVDTTAGKTWVTIDPTIFTDEPMVAGRQYKLTYDLRRVQGSGWSGGYTQYIDFADGWKATGQAWFGLSNLDSWSSIEQEITLPDWAASTTTLTINFQTAGAIYHLDNLHLEDITPDPNTLSGVNADFEDGIVAPWTLYWESDASTTVEVNQTSANSGSYGLQLTSDGLTHTGIGLSSEVFPQELGMNQGIEYRISFDVKSNTEANAQGYIRAVAQGGWDSRVETWFEAKTQWSTVEVIRADVDWSVLANPARLDLYFFENGGAGIDVSIDNVRIEPVTP